MLAFTFDGDISGSTRVYFNGVSQSISSGSAYSFDFSGFLSGVNTSTNNYLGKYYYHHIISKSLSQAEITAHYNVLRSYYP